MWRMLLAFAALLCVSEAAKLPSYFHRCKISDPDRNECVREAAKEAIPILVKGDIHYNIPKMNPLKMAHAVVKYDTDLKFILYDLEISGIETATLSKATDDFEENTVEQIINIPSLNILAKKYELSGKLLNVSLYGQGPANITLVNGEYTYYAKFNTTKSIFEKYNILEHSLNYTTSRTIYQLGNLYADDLISYDFNEILNQNWEKVAEVFRPPAQKIIGDFITLIYSNIGSVVSVEEYFTKD